MTNKFRLSGETIPSIDDPKWETIEVAISTMNPATNPFVLLERADGSFVQACGEPNSLVVEWSQTVDGKQTIYRLGRKGHKVTEEESMSGPPYLLDLSDALVVFEAYYENAGVPRHYRLLDITDRVLEE